MVDFNIFIDSVYMRSVKMAYDSIDAERYTVVDPSELVPGGGVSSDVLKDYAKKEDLEAHIDNIISSSEFNEIFD